MRPDGRKQKQNHAPKHVSCEPIFSKFFLSSFQKWSSEHVFLPGRSLASLPDEDDICAVMGKKGKGDLGANKAAQKAAKRAKQESKAAKLETKKAKKANPVTSTTGKGGAKKGKGSGKGGGGKTIEEEDDLDALLKNFREAWQAEHVTTEEKVGQAPSRRANATLTPCPHGTDLYLFGGEYFDGERALFYPDLYRYTPSATASAALPSVNATPTDSGVWRCYISPTQPGPRSAHQVAATAANGGQLWLFGGEFAGMRMNSFHHYRDVSQYGRATKVEHMAEIPVCLLDIHSSGSFTSPPSNGSASTPKCGRVLDLVIAWSAGSTFSCSSVAFKTREQGRHT
jgi:hypothetical protein